MNAIQPIEYDQERYEWERHNDELNEAIEQVAEAALINPYVLVWLQNALDRNRREHARR